MSFLILLIVIAVINTQQLPNSNYVAQGIFLDKYDPYPSATTVSPYASAVFTLTYNTSASGSCNSKVIIPYGCSASCDTTLDFTSKTTTTQTMDDIKSAYSIKAGISGDLSYFLGTASESMQNMITTTFYNKQVYNQASAEVKAWELSCPVFGMQLSSIFMKYVSMFPTECNETTMQHCIDLIPKTFGHAVSQNLILGGRFYQESYQTQTNYSQLVQDNVNIGLTASSLLADAVQATFQGHTSRADCGDYSDLSSMQNIGQYGGKCAGCNWVDWAKTVDNYQMVLTSTQLVTLDKLLIYDNFPNDPNIKLKAAALQQAIIYNLNNSVTCPNDCNGNGQCIKNKDLNIGECNCTRGYNGYDCSNNVFAVQGQWCGLFINGSNPNKLESYGCNNMKPWVCPKTTTFQLFDSYNGMNMYSCMLEGQMSYWPNGTLCGYTVLGCVNEYYECPEGYIEYDIFSLSNPLCVLAYGNNVGNGVLCGSHAQGLRCADGATSSDVCNGYVMNYDILVSGNDAMCVTWQFD